MIIGFISQISIAKNPIKLAAIEQETKAKQLGQIWNGEEIRRSIILFDKASKNWENFGDFSKASFCLRESAKLSIMISDYKNSSKQLFKALKFDEKTKNIEGQVFSNGLLSQLEMQRGNISKSKMFYTKALDLSNSSSNYAKAFAFYIAGRYSFDFININVALEFFNKALNHSKGFGDTDLKAQILLFKGLVHSSKGNKDESLKNIKEAESIWNNDENQRGLALIYNGLGFTYAISNEKQKALEYYKKAQLLIPEGIDFCEKAKMYSGFASIYLNYGKTNLAEQNYREALKNLQKAQNQIGELAILPELGRIAFFNKDKKSSDKIFERAIFLAKKLNNNFFIANIDEYMGLIDFYEGKYDETIRKLKNAQFVYEKVGMIFPRIKNRIGLAYEKKGDFDLARKYYTSALEENQKIKNVLEMPENLYNLARLSKNEGDFEKALEESNESIQISELIYNDVDNYSLRSSYLSNVFDRYELHINILMNMHDRFPDKGFDEMALRTSEESRSRLMLERLKLSEAEFTRDADPILVKQEKELLDLLSVKSNNLTHLLSINAETESINKLTFEIKEIENELEQTKAELRLESPIYSEIKNPTDFDLKSFQQNVLDEKTVLLEFSLGDEESYLWLVSKEKLKVFKLPKREIIEEKIDKLLKLLINREKLPEEEIADFQNRLVNADQEFQIGAQVLSNDLFGQLINEISNKRLIIVPDGKLQYFPISALPFPVENEISELNEPFLIKNEITFEPSASLLYLIKKSQKGQTENSKEMLIFADPIYSENDNRLTSNLMSVSHLRGFVNKNNFPSKPSPISFERLIASKEESKSITQTIGTNNTTLFSDFSANRDVFLNSNLKDYKIIHFATHGFIDVERPELSAIVLSLYDEEANKRDGFIRLHDIYGLNLNADLVVLSACDLGIGKDIKGQGLMSLTNGFLQVGAKSVVSSLWKVDDYATSELMNNFYQILADEKITTTQALRKAKIKMRENPRYNSPYYWAAFNVQGDFQNIPNISKETNYSKYLLILLSIFTLFGLYYVFKFVKPKLELKM
jgi:CHAT domain-containing protein